MNQGLVPPSIEDPAFLARLRAGEDRAFEELIRSEGGKLLTVARRLVRDEDDARDCLQDAMLQAVRNISSFEGRSKLGTWLHRIVVNAALMKRRTLARHPESSMDDLLPQFGRFGHRTTAEPDSPLPTPEQAAESAEQRQIVQGAINELPEIYRIVLVLRDIEEYDTETVAKMLQIEPGAVKTRLHRARALLKRFLESRAGGQLKD